jgi:hypothetical protein
MQSKIIKLKHSNSNHPKLFLYFLNTLFLFIFLSKNYPKSRKKALILQKYKKEKIKKLDIFKLIYKFFKLKT